MATINMKEQITFLIKLQALDIKYYQCKQDAIAIPKEIQKKEEAFQQRKGLLKELEEKYKLVQLKQREKESLLKGKEENIKKQQLQLFQLKTNKEYQTMLLDIEKSKADCSVIEDEILKAMDELEQIKTSLAQEKTAVEEYKKGVDTQKDDLTKELASVNAQIKELDEKRKEFTVHVDPLVLARYEKVLKNKQGLALVRIEGESCGGCHMNVPPQMINQAKLGNELVVCEMCARILYCEEDNEQVG